MNIEDSNPERAAVENFETAKGIIEPIATAHGDRLKVYTDIAPVFDNWCLFAAVHYLFERAGISESELPDSFPKCLWNGCIRQTHPRLPTKPLSTYPQIVIKSTLTLAEGVALLLRHCNPTLPALPPWWEKDVQ